MYPQLNLDIQLKIEFRLDNFIADSPQAIELHHQLTHLAELPSDLVMFVYGESGSGKSHLLQSACHLAGKLDMSCCYLPMSDLSAATPDLLTGLDQLDLICIDDLQTLAGDSEWELALFNLYNNCRQNQSRLIFASQQRPAECGFRLADLTSRLNWGLTYALPELGDSQKKSLVQQRAKEIGLIFDDATCDYILQRCHRQTGELMQFLDRLDQHSIAGQRRITTPLVRELIQLSPR